MNILALEAARAERVTAVFKLIEIKRIYFAIFRHPIVILL